MVYKSKSSAHLGAAENIIKYNNLYDRWIVTSTIEACIIHQYPDLDHDPKKLASSMAGLLPCCDKFSFPNSTGIYQLRWNRLHYWYFYENTNNQNQAPAYPDNDKDRQKMVDKQASILQSIQTRTTTRSLGDHKFDNVSCRKETRRKLTETETQTQTQTVIRNKKYRLIRG